jgi:hypothetical protein
MEYEDIRDLNQLKIPLAEVRMFIVDLMREGLTEYPLGDFMYQLRTIYREKVAEQHELEGT